MVILLLAALLATQVTAKTTECIESVLRLQLAPDTDTIKGFPEYCYNDTWSRICTIDGTWITNETRTRVACEQLGYSEEDASVRPNVSDTYTVGKPFVSVSKCAEGNKTLQECGVRRIVNSSCMILFNQVQLICYRVTCPKERVRLVGGSTKHQGLVEVCSDGRWGTVQTNKPAEIAREVCRRLGNGEDVADYVKVQSRSSKPVYNCSIIRGTLTCQESIYDNRLIHLNVSCPISNNSRQVRLIGGYSYREGRVEVCLGDDMWESVCNLGQEGIAGEACYLTGFPREGVMVTSYGEEEEGYCCNSTLQNCTQCLQCNSLGVVCQAWDQLQSTNNASECAVQPPMIEPTSSSNIASTTASSLTDFTSLDSTTTTQSRGTELVTSTQPTSTSPDNHTALFGAIIGVLFALLLATLVGWMCTCIIMHRKNTNTTKSTSSTINDPITTDDNYSLTQLIDSSHYEAPPTKPPPTIPSNDATNKRESKIQIIHVECATYDYVGPDLSLSQPTNPTNHYTVTTSDGGYAVIDNIKPKPKPKPSNPPPVKVEASKGEDEFYNAEEHMYTGIDMKAKRDNKSKNAEIDGEEENKTKDELVYSMPRPVWEVEGADVWRVEGSEKDTRL